MSDMKKDDGGPAFPQDLQGRRGDDPQYQGMSLRDYLAAQAMQALIAHHGDSRWESDAEIQSMRGAADTAYEYADAMLEARKK